MMFPTYTCVHVQVSQVSNSQRKSADNKSRNNRNIDWAKTELKLKYQNVSAAHVCVLPWLHFPPQGNGQLRVVEKMLDSFK